MTEQEQRDLGCELFKDFPEFCDIIKNKCWDSILYFVRKHKDELRKIVIDNIGKLPSRWAYYWAKDIGDREILIEKVHESKWAYRWALELGDKEIMIDRVTESRWVNE